MANLRKSTPVFIAYPNPSPSCSIASDRAKRRKVECSHPATLEGNCLLCGRAVDDDGDDHSLPFGFLHPSLRLSREYADRMREVSTAAALGVEEAPLGGPAGGDIFLVGSETCEGFITKLRPFVREFLREAHEMFQLTVYTMGGRVYSSRMTKLLDPDGKYFSDRVIAWEDCTLRGRKSLDVVLAKESNVLILDDTKTVWPDHAENLIAIEPYYYFSHGSEKRDVHDEDKHDRMLVTALRVLKVIHQRFFNPKIGLKGGDVRELLRQLQSQFRDRSSDQAIDGED
ncbi:hypothetical protein NL676_002671 [Syzygium grande]|nr:hypothetical protein NL676_002671 [Syzygium grande]